MASALPQMHHERCLPEFIDDLPLIDFALQCLHPVYCSMRSGQPVSYCPCSHSFQAATYYIMGKSERLSIWYLQQCLLVGQTILSLRLSAWQVSNQFPVSIAGPSIEDASELLRSVAHPLLASLSSHQAELESVNMACLEAQHAQQQPSHNNSNGNGNHDASIAAANNVELSAEPMQLQIQVPNFVTVAAVL